MHTALSPTHQALTIEVCTPRTTAHKNYTHCEHSSIGKYPLNNCPPDLPGLTNHSDSGNDRMSTIKDAQPSPSDHSNGQKGPIPNTELLVFHALYVSIYLMSLGTRLGGGLGDARLMDTILPLRLATALATRLDALTTILRLC